MKQQEGKSKKQRQSTNTKTARHACGTLSYMTESRGVTQKTGSIRWAAPPDSSDKIVRK